MKRTTKEIQKRLEELGFYKRKVDGIVGVRTLESIKKFQSKNGLFPDGNVGPRTKAILFPLHITVPETRFEYASSRNLSMAHGDLQRVMHLARLEIVFRVLDSSRGKIAQNKAFREKRSKARFGDSAHNWAPAIAVDLFPAPYDWNNLAAFDDLSKVVLHIAKEQNVPLRWGGDWNMDGNQKDGWDKPHFELHPWRVYARKSTPYSPEHAT